MKIGDVITKLILGQSAFCIKIFNADIQIPEMCMQALSPFFPPFRPHPPRELAHRLPPPLLSNTLTTKLGNI